MHPLSLANRWIGPSNSLRIRVARLVNRAQTAQRIEALLRQQSDPIAYEVFDRAFILCEPELPGVKGDPDIAIVIGDAEYDLFFVAQRERGGLSSISVHEAIHDAVRDFLRRATGNTNCAESSALIVWENLS